MSAVPSRLGPAAIARGFATGGVVGATLSAFITGIILEHVPLILISVGLPPGYGLLLFVAGIPKRVREAAVVPRLALARIESLHAGGTETGDVPLTLTLTIAPAGAPSFRTETTHSVNLVDLPRYRPGDVLVVAYPPDRPWRARVVPEPPPEWQRRAAGAVVEPAPESTMVREPPEGCVFSAAVLFGLLLGAATVLGLFRVELFTPEPAVELPSSSSTTSSSAGSATVTVDRSLLAAGELRRAVDALARTTDVSQVLTAVVQENRLSVVFAPTDAPVPRFDLRDVPVDRIPDGVRQALSTHDFGAPQTWQVTIVRLPAEITDRATVSGPRGSASVVLSPR